MCCGAPAPLRRTTRRLSSAPWILRTDVSRVDRSPIERGSVSTSGGAWGGSTPIFDSSARNHQHLWPCHRDSAKTGCDTSGGTHDRASRRRASAPQGCCRCTPTSRPARDAGATSSSSAQTVGTAPVCQSLATHRPAQHRPARNACPHLSLRQPPPLFKRRPDELVLPQPETVPRPAHPL